MPSSLPNLTRVGLLAAAPAIALAAGLLQSLQQRDARGDAGPPNFPASPYSHPSGDQLLARTIHHLLQARSIAGAITQTADLFGTQSEGSGFYLQQRVGQQLLFRLEILIPNGEQSGRFLQVGDGSRIWTHEKLGDQEELRKVDLVRLEEELAKCGGEIDRGGEATLGQSWGLVGLLAHLNASFRFRPAGRTRCGQADVWELVGSWRPEELARLFPGEAEAIRAGRDPDWTQLPEPLPHHVVLYIGTEDGFPYGIEYRRRGRQGSGERTVFRLRWQDVRLNVPVDPSYFVYDPPVPPRDETMAVLADLVRSD